MSPHFDLSTVCNVLKLVRPVAQQFAPELLKKYEVLLEEKTQKQKPAIMIHGMYSHGKSTLINALLGEEKAPIGATPTTDGIDRYDWENGACILVDTPGVEAMIHHDKIAEEELKRSELVVFVVESGSVEARELWEKLVATVMAGHKTCLVINDFDGCMANPEKMERLKDAYRQRIQEQSKQSSQSIANIVEQVPLYFINAKSALKARLEKKEMLLRRSGLPKLEEAFVHLASSFSLSDTVAVLCNSLRALVATCRGNMAAAGGDNLLEAAEEKLQAMFKAKNETLLNCKRDLDKKVSVLRPSLMSIFERATDENSVRYELQGVAITLGEELSECIKKHMERSGVKIKELCQEFDAIRLDMDLGHVPDGNTKASGMSMSLVDTALKIDWEKMFGGIDIGQYIQKNIFNVLTKMKECLPSLFEGKGKVALQKMSTQITTSLGMIFAFGSILWQIYNAHSEREAAKEKEQRRLQAISDAACEAQENLRRIFLELLDKMIADLFEPFISPIEDKVRQLRNINTSMKNQKEILDCAEDILKFAS